MGLRGSGKSTLGPRLAAVLRAPLVDLDDRVRDALGVPTISEAFRTLGEPAFREAEVRCLRHVLRETPCVLALGGGTPTAPGAADLLADAIRGGAKLIYLRAGPELLRSRLSGQGNLGRPSLTGHGVVDEVGEVFAARDPLYQRLATGVVEVGGLSEAEAADAVLAMVTRTNC